MEQSRSLLASIGSMSTYLLVPNEHNSPDTRPSSVEFSQSYKLLATTPDLAIHEEDYWHGSWRGRAGK
jgi:hypothetical protein